MKNQDCSAQGTIEYLVIIAIVVVLSLFVVVLSVNFSSSSAQQITDSSSKLSDSAVGGISIVESVLDSSGNSIIKIGNNSSDSLILKKVTVGGTDNSYDEQLMGMDSKMFNLSNIENDCKCLSGQKSVNCEYVLTYLQNGIEKTAKLVRNIDCISKSVPVNASKIVGLGAGTLSDPWIINSCKELQDMNLHLDGNYALGADIDCFETANWNDGAGFEPIGYNQPTPFTGSFDGRGHLIEGLVIYRPTEYAIGLFGFSDHAFISNVNLDANVTASLKVAGLIGISNETSVSNCAVNVNIIADSFGIGGLIGESDFDTITNCSVSGSVVSDSEIVGGIVGLSFAASISNCTNNATIFGEGAVGGIVGQAYYLWYVPATEINSCSNFGKISTSIGGSSDVGGIVGFSGGGIITNCSNFGEVTTTKDTTNLGGIAGSITDSNIYNSYNLGEIYSPSANVGGIVGLVSHVASINSSYNSGNVTSDQGPAGGIIGTDTSYLSFGNCSKIINSYNTGKISSGSGYAGGLAGSLCSTDGTQVISKIINSYSIGDINGPSNSAFSGGIAGKICNYNGVTNVFASNTMLNAGFGLAGTKETNGSITNGYWFNSKLSCYNGGNTGCPSSAPESSASVFFGSTPTHLVYSASPVWDGNWVFRDNNYPILSWQ